MIVIGGGVGPMAGAELHRKIIENTTTNGTDQDHLDVLHLCFPSLVGDRTEFLEGRDVLDPATGMRTVFRSAAAVLGASHEPRAVAGIPCNTFHAPEIFHRFLELLRDDRCTIPVLNMIEETVRYITERYAGALNGGDRKRSGRIGLLSTTGTRSSGVYHDAFRACGVELLEIPQSDQPLLHEAIYHREWGLKAVAPPDHRAVERVQRYAWDLVERGAHALVTGCTELPLAIPDTTFAGVPVVDPLTVLARALITHHAPKKLKPHR